MNVFVPETLLLHVIQLLLFLVEFTCMLWPLPCGLLLRIGLVYCHSICLLGGLLLPKHGHVDRNSRWRLLCGLLLPGGLVKSHTIIMLGWLLLSVGLIKCHAISLFGGLLLRVSLVHCDAIRLLGGLLLRVGLDLFHAI